MVGDVGGVHGVIGKGRGKSGWMEMWRGTWSNMEGWMEIGDVRRCEGIHGVIEKRRGKSGW